MFTGKQIHISNNVSLILPCKFIEWNIHNTMYQLFNTMEFSTYFAGLLQLFELAQEVTWLPMGLVMWLQIVEKWWQIQFQVSYPWCGRIHISFKKLYETNIINKFWRWTRRGYISFSGFSLPEKNAHWVASQFQLKSSSWIQSRKKKQKKKTDVLSRHNQIYHISLNFAWQWSFFKAVTTDLFNSMSTFTMYSVYQGCPRVRL